MIEIGSVVKLKSGGPSMTVSKIDEETALCHWFVKDERQEGKFSVKSLVLESEYFDEQKKDLHALYQGSNR